MVARCLFKPIFRLTTNVVGSGSIVLTPAQSNYLDGSIVQAQAQAANGYSFTGWTGDVVATNNPIQITMITNKNLTATFTHVWNLTATSSVGGVITQSPSQSNYLNGTTILLSALADWNYQFMGWTGSVTGTNSSVSLVMNADKSVGARFQRTFGVVVNVSGPGHVTLTPNKDRYSQGDSVVIEAVPDSGFGFAGWSGAISGLIVKTNLLMNEDKSLTASFKPYWNLSVTVCGKGYVTANPKSDYYLDGSLIQLTAQSTNHWQFVRWMGLNDSSMETNVTITIKMDTNKPIAALFQDITPPTIQITNPKPGTNDNENVILTGTATDNDTITSLIWEKDGVLMGATPIAAGAFKVPGILLHRGTNTFKVTAFDDATNRGSAEVTVYWQPLRSLIIEGTNGVEGQIFTFPISFVSNIPLGGLNLNLIYDTNRWINPGWNWVNVAVPATQNIVTNVPGKIAISLAFGTTKLKAGSNYLANLTLKAKPVLSDAATSVQGSDIGVSDIYGNVYTFGNETIPAQVTIRESFPFTPIGIMTPNGFAIQFQNVSGVQFQIDVSTNLIQWNTLTNWTIPTTNSLFIDNQSRLYNKLFYRIIKK